MVEHTMETDTSKVEISELFNTSWVKSSGVNIIGLVAYAPVGLLLLLIRLFMLLQFFLLSILLPPSKFRQKCLRVMSGVLGMTVSTEDESRNSGCKVYVANSTTNFDQVAAHVVVSSVTPTKHKIGSFWHKPLALIQLENNEITSSKLEASPDPFLLFPEDETTSGERGLLAFTNANLPKDVVIQPLAIKVTRPFLNSSVAASSLFQELLVGLFVPNTHFTLTFLPTETVDEEGKWRDNAQAAIAQKLNLISTKLKKSDKDEYVKKLLFKPPSLTTMVRAVEQKLAPQVVPPEAILAALERTRSVDGALKSLRETYPLGGLGSSTFSKSSNERMSSFQEKKRLMIANARRNYIKKHNLDIPM